MMMALVVVKVVYTGGDGELMILMVITMVVMMLVLMTNFVLFCCFLLPAIRFNRCSTNDVCLQFYNFLHGFCKCCTWI